MSRLRQGRTGRRVGFTILEVLVAMAVLAVGIVGVLQVVAQCQQRTRLNRDRTEANRLAEFKLNELVLQTELTTGVDEGDFGQEYPRYRWQTKVEQTETSGLYRLTVTVNWKSGTNDYAVDLETCQAPGVLTTTSSSAGDAGGGGSPSSSSSSP